MTPLQTLLTTQKEKAREAFDKTFGYDNKTVADMFEHVPRLHTFTDSLVESTAKAVLEAVRGAAMKEYVHKFPDGFADLGLAGNLINRDALLARLDEMEKTDV